MLWMILLFYFALNAFLLGEYEESYEKPLPALRMTNKQVQESKLPNDQTFEKKLKEEIESQQIDEWMIAQGATLPHGG